MKAVLVSTDQVLILLGFSSIVQMRPCHYLEQLSFHLSTYDDPSLLHWKSRPEEKPSTSRL